MLPGEQRTDTCQACDREWATTYAPMACDDVPPAELCFCPFCGSPDDFEVDEIVRVYEQGGSD